MSSITIRHNLQSKFGPSRDQGARPTCLVFATSDAHAAARGPWEDLSCEYLYYHAKRRENAPPSTGARPSFIRQALEHDGQPVEADWRYLVHDRPNPSTTGERCCPAFQICDRPGF